MYDWFLAPWIIPLWGRFGEKQFNSASFYFIQESERSFISLPEVTVSLFYASSYYFFGIFKLFFIGKYRCRFRFMVFNDPFNNISAISWRSVWLVDEIRVSGENHQPAASHWQTLSHVVSSASRHELKNSNSKLFVVICTDCIDSCKSKYHTITITMVHSFKMSK